MEETTKIKDIDYDGKGLRLITMENDDPLILQDNFSVKIEELEEGKHEIINTSLEQKIGDFGYIVKILYKSYGK